MFLFSDDPLFTDEELFLMCAASGRKTVQDTATGNPLVFTTDLARPLKSLLIPFTPVQSGTGDPSPSNIRPLVPWEGLSVFGGGKNLLNPVAENLIPFEDTSYNRYTLVNGQIITTGNSLVGFLVEVKEQTRYSYSFASEANAILEVFSYSAKPNKIRNADTQIAYSTTKKASFVTPNGCKYVVCAIVSTVSANVISDFQLKVGQTATAYEPYVPITETDISFPSLVYGGTLDVVSGVLTVEWALFTAKWKDGEYPEVFDSVTRKRFVLSQAFVTAGSTQTAFCDIAKWYWHFEADEVHFYADQGRAFVFLPNDTDGETEIHIVGKLATPQTVQLTPAQFIALVGNNTIWSDADGSMTAVYLKKG